MLETCDDSNLVEGDGCDTRCHIEAPLAFTESSNGTMVCADTLYPQVESGEYLPLWRK